MKRRQAISKTGWILKTAIFGPTVITAIQSCTSSEQYTKPLRVLNDNQYQLLKVLGDCILPKTTSASASEVGVPEVIDLLLHDVFSSKVVQQFLQGLANFNDDCQKQTGKPFVDLKPEARTEYLVAVDQEVMSETYDTELPFYYSFKKLCIDIYFTTEQGIKQNLNYNPIPGGYQGDVRLEPGEKIEVGNEM